MLSIGSYLGYYKEAKGFSVCVYHTLIKLEWDFKFVYMYMFVHYHSQIPALKEQKGTIESVRMLAVFQAAKPTSRGALNVHKYSLCLLICISMCVREREFAVCGGSISQAADVSHMPRRYWISPHEISVC